MRRSMWAPLHEAAIKNGTDMATLLLKHGADVNAQDMCVQWHACLLQLCDKVMRLCSGGQTALHLAALKNHVEVAKLLLEHGADVMAKKK